MRDTTTRPIPRSLVRIENLGDLYSTSEITQQRERFERLIDFMNVRYPVESERDGESLRFYSAPGRTELGGNHTDHNNGRVLAAAIDLDSIAVVRPRKDSVARIFSEGFGEVEVNLEDTNIRKDEEGKSDALVRGIAAAIAGKTDIVRSGNRLKGFDAAIQSNVFPGSGLSSSASFEVLVAAMVSDLSDIDTSPVDLARIGQYAENVYFGKPCGLMDQMACALGSIVAIDFGDPKRPIAETLSYDFDRHEVDLYIINSGGSHADLTEDYASIPREMMSVAEVFGKKTLRGLGISDLTDNVALIRNKCGDRAFLRAWHFIKENERALAMKDALLSDDFTRYLTLVRESGDSSWKYLQNLFSTRHPEEQGLGCALALTETFTRNGGACRVHGGGFAGTIQAYVPRAVSTAFRETMTGIFGQHSIIPLRIRPHGVVYIRSIS
jgi:galactokinase